MTETADYIVRGDHLAVLSALAVSQASGLESPKTLVWGLDLASAPTRRAAHKQLRLESRGIARACQAQSSLTHLFVVYTHGASLPEGSCLSAAAQTATRLHAELERSRGRFIEVILIDATGWENGDDLRDRVVQSASTPAGVAGDLALGWHDITDMSIHQAATAKIC
ncbi:hypothetical protein ACFC1W_09210 [Microbacterium sp. NPDC056003]|jgi:hypothetical protein|uniref:hypothetical protein n=1 Tax=Microbacterium sp. NPDC056003 TaxID=3345676 RepID=UPI0035E1C1F6